MYTIKNKSAYLFSPDFNKSNTTGATGGERTA